MEDIWKTFLISLYKIVGLGDDNQCAKAFEAWEQNLAKYCHERLLKELKGEELGQYQKIFNQKPNPEQLNEFLKSLPAERMIRRILEDEVKKTTGEHIARLMQYANEEQKEKARVAFRELLESRAG